VVAQQAVTCGGPSESGAPDANAKARRLAKEALADLRQLQLGLERPQEGVPAPARSVDRPRSALQGRPGRKVLALGFAPPLVQTGKVDFPRRENTGGL